MRPAERSHRHHVAALLAVAFLVLTASFDGAAAQARTVPIYPPSSTTVATDKSRYSPGDEVVISAAGFLQCTGDMVTFVITPPGGGTPVVVSTVALPDGTATVTVTAPEVAGTYTVVASSTQLCNDAETDYLVETDPPTPTTVPGGPGPTPTPAPGGATLPRTGADLQRWISNAVTVVFVGGGLWLVAWRRRQARSAS